MKTVLVTGLLLAFSVAAHAQIPNGDFETWQGDSVLVGWFSNTSILGHTIVRSTDAHGGSYALEGLVASYYGVSLPALVQAGVDAQGFPYTSRPATLNGWYKFSKPAGGTESIYINTVLFKGGSTGLGIASGTIEIHAPTSTYTQFSIPINYALPDYPDTAIIQIGIGDTAGATPSPTTTFLVDDFSFQGTNAVPVTQNPEPLVYSLSQNYPNPFNPSTTITFTTPKAGPTSLIVYDILGRKVATLLDGTVAAGRHEVRFDDATLPSGVYIYQLASGGFRATRTMTLVK